VLKKNDVPFVIIDRSIAVVGVAEAARERSLDIPRELALGCFDDIEHASRFLPAQLPVGDAAA
jgi:hypothetical protein